MADFDAPKWVVYILAYFVILFIILVSAKSIQAYLVSSQTIGLSPIDYSEQSLMFGGTCEGVSELVEYDLLSGLVLWCGKIQDGELQEICESYSGCTWQNKTSFLGISVFPERCRGNINNTVYNLNLSSKKDFCTYLNETVCENFGCQFSTIEELLQTSQDTSSVRNVGTTIWKTVKGIALLNIDLGLDPYEWIISVIFFYFPITLLIFALYKTILPT